MQQPAGRLLFLLSAAGQTFFRLREDWRQTGEIYRGSGKGLVSVLDPFQTSRRLSLLKESNFPAGEKKRNALAEKLIARLFSQAISKIIPHLFQAKKKKRTKKRKKKKRLTPKCPNFSLCIKYDSCNHLHLKFS